MKHLIEQIKDKDIREGVEKIVYKHYFVFQYYLCSFSGRFHPREKYLYQHVERCVYFAKHLLDEFKIHPFQRDVIIAACILHDIGKLYCAYDHKHTPNQYITTIQNRVSQCQMQYHENTGWYQNQTFQRLHPILSSFIIGAHPFKQCRQVQDLVEIHMSHWSKQACRQPDNILHYIMCSSDYLASRDIDIPKESL